MTKQEVIDFLTGGFQLANLPVSFSQLRQIAQDPHSDLEDVVNVARQDQELAASLLKLANSSLYSNGSETYGTIEESVQRIGLSKVVEHSLALGIVKRIQVVHDAFDINRFWRRSITVGRIAEELFDVAPKMLQNVVDRQQLFTAGLLHDIGLLALIQGFSGEMMTIFDKCICEDRQLHFVEEREFGFTHQDVGRILFKKWGLPEELQCVAGYHHDPLEVRRRLMYPLVDMIHIADYLCCICSDDPISDFKPQLNEAVWVRSGLSLDLLDQFKPQVQDAVRSADTLLAC